MIPANKSGQLVYEKVVFALSDDRNNGNVTISVPSGTIQNVAESITGNAPVIYAVVVGKLRFNNKSRAQPQTRSQVSFCQLFHAGMSGCKQVSLIIFTRGNMNQLETEELFMQIFDGWQGVLIKNKVVTQFFCVERFFSQHLTYAE